jgi:hypothetical protein
MPKNVTPSAAEGPKAEDKLREFLVKLATDHAEFGQFMKDPDASMERAGLSTEEQTLLKSGNAAAINARLTGKTVPKAPPPLLLVDLSPDGTPTVRETSTPHIVAAALQAPAQFPPHIVAAGVQPFAHLAPQMVATQPQLPPQYPAHIVAPLLQAAVPYPPHIVSPALPPAAQLPPHIVAAQLPPSVQYPPHIVAPAFQPAAYYPPHIVMASLQPLVYDPYTQQWRPPSLPVT